MVLSRDELLLYELNRLEDLRESLSIERCKQRRGRRANTLKKSLDIANGEFKAVLDELNQRSAYRFVWE